MKKGSISVFMTMVLVLILSFTLSMLEGARTICMDSRAQLLTQAAMQSLFGKYHRGVWEEYRLLFLDSGNGLKQQMEEEILQNLTGNFKDGTYDLTKLALEELQVSSYQMADGAIFLEQVCDRMQQEVTLDVMEQMLKVIETEAAISLEGEQTDISWEDAQTALLDAKNWEDIPEEENVWINQGPVEDAELKEYEDLQPIEMENPMELVQLMRESALLPVVVKDISRLSDKRMTQEPYVLTESVDTANLTERIWLQYYIQGYFRDFISDPQDDHVLNYEVEYLIAGEDSDSENLEAVVLYILGIRETMNFATIMKDTGKKELAFSAALAIAGFTGVMPLVRAVQIGILLAWAFVESILDIRSLLDGKKVPLLKSASQWVSSLEGCRNAIETKTQAGEEEEGMDYRQYLQILLLKNSAEKLCQRCMALIGQNQKVDFRRMIYGVEGNVTYRGQPLFFAWTPQQYQVAYQMSYELN